MFDIGFSEILMFGAMALIVLGPEKLPHAARTAGKWYAKIRFTIANVQREIEQELDIAETRRAMEEELAKIRQAEASMKKELAEIRDSVQSLNQQQHQSQKESANIDPLEPPLESSPTSINPTTTPDTSKTNNAITIHSPDTFAIDTLSHENKKNNKGKA